MDGAGAAASVIAFADAGIKSAKCIREFISIVKDGGQTVALFGQDVDTLATALQRISLLSLNDSSPPTIASLKTHLEACSKELVTYEKLIQGLDRSSPRLANRMRMAARTMWKDKDLEQARNRIRDLNTQLGVYLCLLQAEAAARASLRQTSTAETTRDLLQQILGEFGRVHTRLDGIDTASAAAMNTQDTPVRELTPDSPDVTEACNELQESVSRLASLVDHEEAIIDAEDAHHIIDDLETLIQSARDRVSCTQVENPSSKDQERGGDGRNVRDNIWLAQSLVCSAPVLAINQSGGSSLRLLILAQR
jgi:hypothetical protein